MNKETQKKKVLHYLDQHGSITTFEAVTELHIMSIAKRIEELRKDGYHIVTNYVYVNGNRFGMYELLEEGDGVCLAN